MVRKKAEAQRRKSPLRFTAALATARANDEARQRYLSTFEFAAALNMTPAGVRKWLLQRRIAFFKVGRLVRISESELDRLLDEGFRPAKTARAS